MEQSGGEKNMRIALEDGLHERWQAALKDRGVSQQRAVVSIIDWFTHQEPLVQIMILGQVPAKDQKALALMVLDRLATGGKESKFQHLVSTTGKPGGKK